MYVRNQNTGQRVRPPDNYSGNAFDREGYRTSPDLPLPQSLLPAAQNSHPVNEGLPLPELDDRVCEEDRDEDFGASDREPEPVKKQRCESDDGGGLKGLLTSIMPPRADGCRGEFGIEDMLIIGLIFLLTQSEGEEDILLALALLLFYK